MNTELRDAILGTAGNLGIDAVDLATVMSYETAGTFNPWKKGPVTQYGRHRGLIQWGGPQRAKYGVYKNMPVADQVKAAGEYLKDAGVKPGMGLLDVYSAINAGRVGRYNASDANNGGAPGTVRDKVEKQMGGHRRKALALMGATATAPTFDPTAFGAVPLDAPTAPVDTASTAAPPTTQAAFAGDTPVAPAVGALDTLVQPVSAKKPIYQVDEPNTPVPFDPVAAGAVPFQPENAGAVPILGTTPTMVVPETNQPPGVPEFKPVGVDNYDPKTGNVTMDALGTFLTSGAEGVPVVGPLLDKGVVNASAGIGSVISGEPFAKVKDEMQTRLDQSRESNPVAHVAGNVAGAAATFIPAAATSTGGYLLGMTGNSLLGRMGMSAASNGLISAVDTAMRGGTLADVIKSGGIGATIGGALPGAGAAVNAMARPVVNAMAPRVNALVRPAYEGARRVGQAMGIDAKNVAAPLLSQADEAAAAANSQQLLNVDRGGETTRALARSAANQDPEARAIIDKTVSDRFAAQGDRAQSFIGKLMGGATDDLAVQDSLKAAARASNKPAYEKAFNAPAAQDMFSPGLKDLLASPAIKQAAKDAETRGANRAVVEGFNPVKNPFVFDDAGQATLRTDAKPTLQFWDQVKRNLDAEIGKASRGGDKTLVSDLSALKSKLTSELDTAVPEYAAARRGAAAFFGAEDALDAGKKFVTQNRTIPETRRALAQMSPAERSTFAVGFASELKDSIAQSGDRTNVINKIFGSQQARDKIEAALGPQAYKEFEQFVRVEHSMDMLRGAMGNSTTARQLMELGLAGGAGIGTTAFTGDWKSGMTAAVLTGLARRGGAKIDERVTKRIAQLLLSDDPKALQQAVTIASNSPKAASAIQAIQNGLSMATKIGGNVATRPSDPVADPSP